MLNTVFSRCEDIAKKNKRKGPYIAWTIGYWDPVHEVCISYQDMIRLRTVRSKQEEERKAGTIREKLERCLTSVMDILKCSKGKRDSPIPNQ